MKNGYAEFLRIFDWNYFITCRTHYKVHIMTTRNWINKLISSRYKVENVFPCDVFKVDMFSPVCYCVEMKFYNVGYIIWLIYIVVMKKLILTLLIVPVVLFGRQKTN